MEETKNILDKLLVRNDKHIIDIIFSYLEYKECWMCNKKKDISEMSFMWSGIEKCCVCKDCYRLVFFWKVLD